MSILKKDEIEVWYFKTALQRDKREVEKAVGYSKTVNGVLKKSWGKETRFPWVRSKTDVRREK